MGDCLCWLLVSAQFSLASRSLFRVLFLNSVFQCSVFSLLKFMMNTYHAAFWSSDPSRLSSSDEEEDVRDTMYEVERNEEVDMLAK